MAIKYRHSKPGRGKILGSKVFNSNNFQKPKTLSQSIYERLKESILNKELEPNQRINEKEIAESFQVSRTPVREAVARLVAKGFVEIISHREALVKEVSYGELKDIFQVIGVLDRLAVSLIIDQIDSVIGCLIILCPFSGLTMEWIIAGTMFYAFIHILINLILFLTGIRENPL